MDVLEQAEQAVRAGSDQVKQELLGKVDLVFQEICCLIADDPEFTDGNDNLEDLKAAARHYTYQNSCDLDSALISTACAALFTMFHDCERFDYYQLVTPAWLKDWYEKANAWDMSHDGTLKLKPPVEQ